MLRRNGGVIGYISDKPRRSLLAAALCFVVFGAIEFVSHEFLSHTYLSAFGDAVLDSSIVAASSSVLIWFILAGHRERRKRVREELERIAELNHEIRNALEVIVHSHYSDKDEGHRQMVLESVKRIDTVVKRVSRIVGAPQPPKSGRTSPNRRDNGSLC